MKLSDMFDQDLEHAQAAAETGFWGKQGAGAIIYAKSSKRFLLGFRSEYVMEGLTWGTFGGAIDENENPKDAVMRELHEEIGFNGHVDQIIPLYIFKKDSFRYHNFVVIVDEEFEPDLNWENAKAGWFEYGKWPSPLHFGCKAFLSNTKAKNILKKLAQ